MSSKKELEQRLTLKAVIAISISSMLGSGIFVLPGIAIKEAGPSVWLAYFFASLSVLPAAMSKAELATAMPTSGGTYVYLERTFGPLAGTLAGLGLWLSLLLKSAFALIGISSYLLVLTSLDPMMICLFTLFAIVFLNIIGIGKVGATIIAIVTASLIGLFFVGAISIPRIDMSHLAPLMPMGGSGLMAATGMVFVSYAGVTKVAAIAEEVKNPERNLPLGILLSLFLVTVTYCSLTFILVGVIPWEELTADLKPVYTLSRHTGGESIGIAAAILAILTMASMANSGVLAASRFPFAMARDRLLPSFLGFINKKYLTPHVAIIASGIFVLVCLLTMDVAKIAKIASAFILIIYIAENLAVMVLRETRVNWYKPAFKAPFYPLTQIFGILSGGALLIGMGQVVVPAILGVLVPGVAIYMLYSRRRTSRLGVIGVRVRRKELEAPSRTLAAETDAEVIVSLFGKERSPETLVELGAILAQGATTEVIHVTEVPEQTTIHDIKEIESGEVVTLKRRINSLAKTQPGNIDFDHIVSHDMYKVIHELSSRLHSHWLIKEWGGRSHGAFTMHKQMGWLEEHLDCNIVNYKDAGIRYISKVMLIMPHDWTDKFFIETAKVVAKFHKAQLWFVGFVYADFSEAKKNKARRYLQRLQENHLPSVPIKLIEGENFVESTIEASIDFDLIIMRSKSKPTAFDRVFGSNQDKIIEKATCSVLSIRYR